MVQRPVALPRQVNQVAHRRDRQFAGFCDLSAKIVEEEHFCNARVKGVVFSGGVVPLWRGHTKRLATKAQMNALRALYGARGGCGADMWICDGRHIRPVCEGGPTNIDNMMLLCCICHQKVHHHRWRVAPDGRGLYTIAPPERIRHGPDQPPTHHRRGRHVNWSTGGPG